MATGLVLFGPVGFGAAKTEHHVKDARQLFLVIEGPGVAVALDLAPEVERRAREFAAAVNGLVAALPAPAPNQAALVDQLRELAALNAAGALSDEEFAAAKAQVITDHSSR